MLSHDGVSEMKYEVEEPALLITGETAEEVVTETLSVGDRVRVLRSKDYGREGQVVYRLAPGQVSVRLDDDFTGYYDFYEGELENINYEMKLEPVEDIDPDFKYKKGDELWFDSNTQSGVSYKVEVVRIDKSNSEFPYVVKYKKSNTVECVSEHELRAINSDRPVRALMVGDKVRVLTRDYHGMEGQVSRLIGSIYYAVDLYEIEGEVDMVYTADELEPIEDIVHTEPIEVEQHHAIVDSATGEILYTHPSKSNTTQWWRDNGSNEDYYAYTVAAPREQEEAVDTTDVHLWMAMDLDGGAIVHSASTDIDMLRDDMEVAWDSEMDYIVTIAIPTEKFKEAKPKKFPQVRMNLT